MASTEKEQPVTDPVQAVDSSSQDEGIHEYREAKGYEVDVEDAAAAGGAVKLAKDGRTRLIPRPSDDPADPLNWSQRKKNIILAVVAFCALLPDYGSATGAVTLLPQAAQWNMTEDEVNASQVGNVFMLGAGGIFGKVNPKRRLQTLAAGIDADKGVVVAFSAFFGRLPVMFYFLVVALPTAAWCAAATNFESFETARILNGFFSTVSQVNGLIIIQDMFFFHERARKINIWASFFVISPYLGPLLAAFQIATKPWPTPFWVYTAETALGLALTILLVEETFYDRRIPQAEQPDSGTRVTRLLGVAQWKSRHLRNTISQACMRPLLALTKPVVLISCCYYFLTFAWVVGINTTLSIFLAPLYGFGPKQIGFFYFTPVVAVILGETAGHWLHDMLAKQYIRAHNGRFEPEARLRAIAVALPFMVVGLVLLGQCLENGWHYMATSVSWGLYTFGIMITTVAVSSYNLDCYPEASGEVSAWVNNSRTLGGFVVSYFQVRWAEASGTRVSFGIQAAVCAAAFLLIVLLMVKGKAMRIWSGPLRFATT
ncbi:Uu.00g121950.m01.CDS01 [Anthostomella pinea]|uniref:Uu.00g121950.m01.CDS01 n=1 Tax=Anthostomella pinea TaxID=933095 RepID=A0AAI8YHD6_9PEZI|nr:Uu.00g121950.m01.CDS01 [Anthostomella pinea]